MSLTVHQIAVGGYDDNFAYVIAETESKQAFIVDPSGDWAAITATITAHDLTPIGVLLTHTHHDHIDQLEAALAAYTVPVYVHELGTAAVAAVPNTKLLKDGDAIMLGNHTIDVIYTPGHITDHVCFYSNANQTIDQIPTLIAGDTLFVGGCGRTTEAGVQDLYESLQKLKALPDHTLVYPGHDYGATPHSTIGYEKTHNAYLLAPDREAFITLRLG